LPADFAIADAISPLPPPFRRLFDAAISMLILPSLPISPFAATLPYAFRHLLMPAICPPHCRRHIFTRHFAFSSIF